MSFASFVGYRKTLSLSREKIIAENISLPRPSRNTFFSSLDRSVLFRCFSPVERQIDSIRSFIYSYVPCQKTNLFRPRRTLSAACLIHTFSLFFPLCTHSLFREKLCYTAFTGQNGQLVLRKTKRRNRTRTTLFLSSRPAYKFADFYRSRTTHQHGNQTDRRQTRQIFSRL